MSTKFLFTKTGGKMKWLQKCLICNYKCKFEGKPEDEEIIRAACLPCGHQGMFTLEEIEEAK